MLWIKSDNIECALFGDYVDELKAMMAHGMPIVMIQFAKIKIFRGWSHHH
jgi:hypothetical protein